ncbi:unnamed protein product [Ixodes hexagonus]
MAPPPPGDWGPEGGTLEEACREKDLLISSLEREVAQQRQLRAHDARQVEAKAMRIKDWVAHKLRELELQNAHLQEQNQRCNEQLELLKRRLVQLSQLSQAGQQRPAPPAEEDEAPPAYAAVDFASLPPPLQKYVAGTRFRNRELYSTYSWVTLQYCVLLQAQAGQDSNNKNTKLMTSCCQERTAMSLPPGVRIERKRYRDDLASLVSSTASDDLSEMDCGRARRCVRHDGVFLQVVMGSSKGGREPYLPEKWVGDAAAGDGVSCSLHCMRRRLPPPPAFHVSMQLPYVRAMSGHQHKFRLLLQGVVTKHGRGEGGGVEEGGVKRGGDQGEEVECQRRAIYMATAVKGRISGDFSSRMYCRTAMVSADEEHHDYAEIYTPSRELADFGVAPRTGGRPPTPPLHRFPSWESRIYEVAVNGITQSLNPLPSGEFVSSVNGLSSAADSRMNSAFSELSVPVYAAVKGRASQIRSVPFTGDSSDSSDNEDNTRATTSGADTESSLSAGSPTGGGPVSGVLGSRGPLPSPTKSVRRGESSLTGVPHSRGRDKSNNKSDFTAFFPETSVESVLSDDYAVPPDAVSTDTLSLDSVDPFPPPRPPRLSEVTSPRKNVCLSLQESLEKSGYLTKLGGKLKTWKRRWFVLKNGALRYYKSQGDTMRKPRGQIILDDVCRVTRSEGAATFEIATGKRSFYLSAESTSTMEEWVKVLQCVLRRNATRLLLSKEDHKPAIDGWLTKVKHGHSRRCWCSLIGRTFLYFKTPNDTTPLGQISMRDVHVEEVVHVSDSDEEEAGREGPVGRSEYTVGIFPPHQSPTYLLFASKQELDTWLYHLTVVSSGDSVVGTQYEQLMSKLMEVDGDESDVVWRHPLLLHTKESIAQPLTTLPSEALQTEAVKLFKSIQLFISVPLDASGIDYHVALAQNALAQCLGQPELQNELFCQLVKQTSRHSHHKLGVQQLLLCATQSLFLCDTTSSGDKGSPTSNCAPSPEKGGSPKGGPHLSPCPPESKQNPPPFVFIQGWQLLALAVSLFPPRNRTLWYLRAHLQRNADTKSEPGKYAVFCQRALERALHAGERECKPSRMEVLSILLKNPFHHSNPHSIPVHFLNGTYLVVGFDGSTTVEEFIGTLNAEAGMRDTSQSGFALYSDDPIDKGIEHCLNLSTKLCDVISRWEQALREKHLGKFENTRVIKLTYKNRQLLKSETDKERLLTVYYVNDDLVHGRFPLSHELSLELAALMAQVFPPLTVWHCYLQPLNHNVSSPPFVVFSLGAPDLRRPLCTMEAIRERWSTLKGKAVVDCVRIYLNCVRKWSFCGARLFSARIKAKEQQTIWLAVTEDGISLLDCSCMQPWARYPYSSVMTFGGCRDDFMLVVCPDDSESLTERLLFVMPKPKILELTLLVADYMNALRTPSGGSGSSGVPPGSPMPSTLARLERIRARIRAGNQTSSSANASPALSTSSRRPLLPTPDS